MAIGKNLSVHERCFRNTKQLLQNECYFIHLIAGTGLERHLRVEGAH